MAYRIYASNLQAKLVTLDNTYTQALSQVVIDVLTSGEAEAAAVVLDDGTDTHTSVLEYYVTKDTGIAGDVMTFTAQTFKKQVEPSLVLKVKPKAK